MKISQICIERNSTHSILSANCGGFDLWYKFPSKFELKYSADPFITACLFPSMVLGSNIELDDDVTYSSELLTNLELLQTIFCHWQSYLRHPLKKIEIIGGTAVKNTVSSNRVASFFSGGVDGNYTFKKHQSEIDLAIFVKGIDIQLSNDRLYQEAFLKNRAYLENHNTELIACETNIIFLGFQLGIGWTRCLGGGLSSIAHALNVKKCFIASSLCYENVVPEGSNYVTDHLWGSGCTQIVHDGAEARRIEKIKSIAKDQELLSILRVCWHDKTYNCGECEKCLRTMTSLRALKLTAPTFSILTNEIIKSHLHHLKLYSAHDLEFYNENIDQCLIVNDNELARVLIRIRRNYELRQLFRQIDNTLFSGNIHKIKLSLLSTFGFI